MMVTMYEVVEAKKALDTLEESLLVDRCSCDGDMCEAEGHGQCPRKPAHDKLPEPRDRVVFDAEGIDLKGMCVECATDALGRAGL